MEAWTEPLSWTRTSVGLAQINNRHASRCLKQHRPHTYLYLHPPCHTSIMSPSTSVMDLNTAFPTSTSIQRPLISPPTAYVSPAVRLRGSWRDWTRTRLQVLNLCAEKLYGILQHLFNLSLSQEKVPVLWKTCHLVPQISCPNKTPYNESRRETMIGSPK